MDGTLIPLRDWISGDGFAFAPAASMRPMLGVQGAPSDWDAFAASWADLPLDTQLPDGHRYRRRRHATLSARAGEDHWRLEPHRPHYQSLDYNPLVGGIERWFEPIHGAIVEGATFDHVLRFCLHLFGSMRPQADWHIECHQFRIEARPGAAGQPTPEGVHRDGVDYVLVFMVSRTNVESGTTTVHAADGKLLGSFTLSEPFDAALVDDNRVKHGVTAVRPIDPKLPAYRDVMVVTLRVAPRPASG
ncbi:MAG TPA: 2OG-Fe dioxygenase family protein [Usitatibacter sp.]